MHENSAELIVAMECTKQIAQQCAKQASGSGREKNMKKKGERKAVEGMGEREERRKVGATIHRMMIEIG